MIQDSINQMLATAAIGTKLLSGGITDAREAKMGNLQAQQDRNLEKLKTGPSAKPDQYISDEEAAKGVKAVEETQSAMNKLGKKKLFPNPRITQTADQYSKLANEEIAEYKNKIVEHNNEYNHNIAQQAMKRAQEAALAKQMQANRNFIQKLKVKQFSFPSLEEIQKINGGK